MKEFSNWTGQGIGQSDRPDARGLARLGPQAGKKRTLEQGVEESESTRMRGLRKMKDGAARTWPTRAGVPADRSSSVGWKAEHAVDLGLGRGWWQLPLQAANLGRYDDPSRRR